VPTYRAAVGTRRERWSLDVGTEPDPRFSYANERTFLAWCRTALALMTAGLAITQLLPGFDIPGGRRLIGLPLIAAGTVLATGSLVQWYRAERAMRLGQPLPRSPLVPGVAAVVAITAAVALVLVVADSL
jgi:putative membrane protein